MSRVLLAFPPIVETSFGSYYPALATLSAALRGDGHEVRVADLNEDFAEYLLRPENLARAANGRASGSPADIEAIGARFLQRLGPRLYDARGRHDFRDRRDHPAYLLHWIAAAHRVDAPVAELVEQCGARTPWVHELLAFHHERLPDEPPDLLGISVPMGPQILPALALATAARERWPATRIVLGGPSVSLMDAGDLAGLLARMPEIDAVVRFEGERPLLALARQLHEGRWAPLEVPGVAAVSNGEARLLPPGAGIPLGDAPFADYDATLLDRLADPELGVVQSRGCYWGRCTYCDFVELYKGSAPYRVSPSEKLVAEIAAQRERHGVDRYCLITEALAPALAERVSRGLLERRVGARWSSFVMVDRRFDVDTFTLMAEAGCEMLVLGLETMNDRVLSLVDKHATRAMNEAFLGACRRAGIRVVVNLIPDLPSTTRAEAMAALEALEGIRDLIDRVSVFPFEATRSSRVGRDPTRYGLVPGGSTTPQAQFSGNHLGWSDPAMTPDERAEVHAAYRTFARSFQHLEAPAPEAFRVDLDRLDFVPTPDGVQVTDWRTRRIASMPPDWQPMVARLARRPVIHRQDVVTTLGPERGAALLALLEQAGGMVAVQAGA